MDFASASTAFHSREFLKTFQRCGLPALPVRLTYVKKFSLTLVTIMLD
jgi:hypothetical protein